MNEEIKKLQNKLAELEKKVQEQDIDKKFVTKLIDLHLKDINVQNIYFKPRDGNPTRPAHMVYYKDGTDTGLRINFDGFIFQLDATAV